MYSLAGPPGSGKSTHVQALVVDGMIPVSAGTLLRQQAPADILAEMNRGRLANHDYTNSLIKQALDGLVREHGWEKIILDGYPRAVIQARWFLEDYGARLQKCLLLRAPDEFLIQNLLSRGRADDVRDSIQNRLTIFKENTAEVLTYYATKGIPVVEISADQPLEDVLEDIRRVLGFV